MQFAYLQKLFNRVDLFERPVLYQVNKFIMSKIFPVVVLVFVLLKAPTEVVVACL